MSIKAIKNVKRRERDLKRHTRRMRMKGRGI